MFKNISVMLGALSGKRGPVSSDLESVFSPFWLSAGPSFPWLTPIEEKLITDFFEDPSHMRKSVDILRRDRLPSRLADACTGYAALSVLAAHSVAQGRGGHGGSFFRVCHAFGIGNSADIQSRLSGMGDRASELILKETHGLTRVETAALQTLKQYYRTRCLSALTKEGAFSASLSLDTAEAIALKGLLSQKKQAAATMEKFFFYSGLYDYIVHDMSVYQAKTGGKEVVSRVLEEDVVDVRNTHLEIYSDALGAILQYPDLTPQDRCHVQTEIRRVARDMVQPLVMTDTSASVKTAKKSLTAALGKKGNIAFTRERFALFLETLESHTLLGINPKEQLQRFTETAINKQRPWLKKTFPVGALTSVITPTNVATLGDVRNTVMEARGTGGVGCQSNLSCTTAAANNQITELFAQDEQLLFAGVRHGIVATQVDPSEVYVDLSPNARSISDLTRDEIVAYIQTNRHIMSDGSRQRLSAFLGTRHGGVRENLDYSRSKLAKHVANYAKAKDLLRSAIFQKIKSQSLSGRPVSDNGVFHVELVSLSLVTPDAVRPVRENPVKPYHERQMLSEQKKALHALTNMSDSEKSALLAEYQDASGGDIFSGEVTLEIGINTFNFGVNEGEFAGRMYQNGMNAAAMPTFLSYAQSQYDTLTEARDQDWTKDRDLFGLLRARVAQAFRAYPTLSLSKQANPYVLPVLVAVLSHFCGISPLFNCKSGKDRTSLMDVMVKVFVRQLHDVCLQSGTSFLAKDKALNYFQQLDRAYTNQCAGRGTEAETAWLISQQKANREMLFNSGNREVQEENTTAWGYKLEGKNTARMFAAVFGIENMGEVYGFSKLIEA